MYVVLVYVIFFGVRDLDIKGELFVVGFYLYFSFFN